MPPCPPRHTILLPSCSEVLLGVKSIHSEHTGVTARVQAPVNPRSGAQLAGQQQQPMQGAESSLKGAQGS